MRRRTLLASLAGFTRLYGSTPVISSGAYSYEVTHDWAQPPAKIQFGNTHGIIVTADRRVVVAHTVHKNSESPDAICIFDDQGKFIKSWGRICAVALMASCFSAKATPSISITATT